MVRIIWNVSAREDVERIRSYIAQFDPVAAQRLAQRIIKAGDSLADFPHRGRPASGTRRELTSVPPYIIRYRVTGNAVYITRIKHGRQLR